MPAVAARAEGGFVAAWQVCRDDDTCTIRSRSFGLAGEPLGIELPVSPAGQSSSSPGVAVDARGAFGVTWRQCLSGPFQFTNCTAHARFFDPQGIPLGTVSLRWSNNLLAPVVAAYQSDFLLTWDASSCIGFGCGVPRPTGIYAERYRLDVQGCTGTGSAPPAPALFQEAATDVFCIGSSDGLCVDGSHFAVEVAWRTPDGAVGRGKAVQLTADSGVFWFFQPDNLELVSRSWTAVRSTAPTGSLPRA